MTYVTFERKAIAAAPEDDAYKSNFIMEREQ